MLFAPLAALLGLAAPALATIYTTSPVAATVATAGQVLNVSWVDDGTSPNLTTIGVCSIDLCVGSTTQQTCLQNLGESVDVSLASYLTTTINATAGESGDYWFVRYTSTNYTNATTAEPYMQFSARFTINNMTGTFDAAVSSEIATSTSVASSSTVASSTKSSTAAVSTTSAAHNSTSTGASATAAASTTVTASAADEIIAPVAFALLAGIAGYIAL